MPAGNTKTITENALVKRLNRKLAHEGDVLSYGRDPWGSGDCYRVMDRHTNMISGTVHDLEALGREVGVLLPNEVVA